MVFRGGALSGTVFNNVLTLFKVLEGPGKKIYPTH